MYENKSILSLAHACLSGTKLTHRHKKVLWIAQLFFTHTATVGVRELHVPKSTLLLWYIPGKKKFHQIFINVSKHIRIWNNGEGGEETKCGKKQTFQKIFQRRSKLCAENESSLPFSKFNNLLNVPNSYLLYSSSLKCKYMSLLVHDESSVTA